MNNNSEKSKDSSCLQVLYKRRKIEGLEIFYRCAGDPANPAIVLLHGFPSSSHMFRKLIPLLADKFYIIAPDYPGFGCSAMPLVSEFHYCFEQISMVIEKLLNELSIQKFILYCQDYGGPVGFRMAVRNPDRVLGFVIQNTAVSRNGLGSGFDSMRALWRNQGKPGRTDALTALKFDATKKKYLHGAENPQLIGGDGYSLDQYFLDREGNADIQMALWYDYRHNIVRYPQWQEYLRRYQPLMLVTWGKNDYCYTLEGARTFKYLVKNAKLYWLEGGHFILEEKYYDIAFLIRQFFIDECGLGK